MIGLHVEHSLNVAYGPAVVHPHISHTARHLRTDAEQYVSVFHHAVPYHNVFSGLVQSPGILVTTSLDHHSVISLVEMAVLDQQIACHIDVDAVVVVPVGIHIQSAHHSFVAHIEVDGPERTFAYLEVFEHDVLAAIQLYQMGAHIAFRQIRQSSFFHGCQFRTPAIEFTRCILMSLWSFEPHLPQVHLRCQRSCARNLDVLAFEIKGE